MKKLAAAAVILLLAGCASAPRPQLNIAPHKAHVIKAVPKPVSDPSPNQTVKKRWYDRFKVHPKWFHH